MDQLYTFIGIPLVLIILGAIIYAVTKSGGKGPGDDR